MKVPVLLCVLSTGSAEQSISSSQHPGTPVETSAPPARNAMLALQCKGGMAKAPAGVEISGYSCRGINFKNIALQASVRESKLRPSRVSPCRSSLLQSEAEAMSMPRAHSAAASQDFHLMVQARNAASAAPASAGSNW